MRNGRISCSASFCSLAASFILTLRRFDTSYSIFLQRYRPRPSVKISRETGKEMTEDFALSTTRRTKTQSPMEAAYVCTSDARKASSLSQGTACRKKEKEKGK